MWNYPGRMLSWGQFYTDFLHVKLCPSHYCDIARLSEETLSLVWSRVLSRVQKDKIQSIVWSGVLSRVEKGKIQSRVKSRVLSRDFVGSITMSLYTVNVRWMEWMVKSTNQSWTNCHGGQFHAILSRLTQPSIPCGLVKWVCDKWWQLVDRCVSWSGKIPGY